MSQATATAQNALYAHRSDNQVLYVDFEPANVTENKPLDGRTITGVVSVTSAPVGPTIIGEAVLIEATETQGKTIQANKGIRFQIAVPEKGAYTITVIVTLSDGSTLAIDCPLNAQ